MALKYPKASLWRMKRVELLVIADSEPELKLNAEMTRAELIAEILTIESDEVYATAITEYPVQTSPAPELTAPTLPENEEEDLPPASPRIRRIRQANK